MAIEVGKPEEGHYIPDFLGFRPDLDGLDFVLGHRQAVWRQHMPQIFTQVTMALTLAGLGIEPIALKLGKYFLDMGQVLFGVIGIHQDVVQVYNYRDINHIGEYIIHEPLETGWGSKAMAATKSPPTSGLGLKQY